MLLVGDFNIDIPHVQPSGRFSEGDTRLFNLLSQSLDPLNLTQYVDFITRRYSDEDVDGTIIDHLYCNNPNIIQRVSPHDGITGSDHSGIHLTLSVVTPKPALPPGTFFQYSKADIDGLRNDLNKINWHALIEDKSINGAWCAFRDKFLACIHNFVPKRKAKRNPKKPWITLDTINLARKKHKLYRSYRRSPNNLTKLNNYKQCRNKLKSQVRKDYHNYLVDIAADDSNNGTKFWSFVRASKAKQSANSFKVDDNDITDPTLIANTFNEFFASNFTDADSDCNTICEGHIGSHQLSSISTDANEIFDLINHLKSGKAPGSDGITSTMLKLTAGEIALPLTLLFNYSLREGLIPDDWKRAIVVPIHKSGDISSIKNYRPITLCSVVGKLLERVVTNRMIGYMREVGLISKQQHGFVAGRSCTTLLSTVCHHWAQLLDVRSPPVVDVIFLDWSKAFDKVSHSILLSKLHNYGICGPMWHWISSFLNQRYQSVQFRGSSSNWLPVLSGVPQGSVLGPLLFNLFVLDLPNFVQSNLPQYADDTLLYRPIYSEDDVTIMQKDLDNIISWCILNKMCLNADKCKVMRLSKKLACDGNIPSYKISNSSLSVVQNYKYLGVIISSNLKWNDHVNHVASRTSRLLGFIKRIVRCNDPAILSRLYKTLCRPIIEYGAPAWLPYQQSHINRLEKVQKRLARSCIPAPRGELTYQFRLEKLGLSSLENRFHYLAIAFVSKCIYRVYDVDPFVYVRINTRHTDTIKFHHNFGRTDCFKYNVYTRFPVQFQSLPRHIRDKLTISLSSFLSNCKLHFKQSSWLDDS